MRQNISNEANWAIDGRVVMDRYSHFQHVSRLTFQLVSYIFQQLPPEYECLIDSEKFFNACTITIDSTNDKNMNTADALVTGETVDTDDGKNLQGSTTSTENTKSLDSCRRRVDAGKWTHAPDGAILDTYCMNIESISDVPTNQLNAVVQRRAQIFTWLDHLESRSKFIPSQHKTDFVQEREKIKSGQLGIRGKRPQNTGMQLLDYCNILMTISR